MSSSSSLLVKALLAFFSTTMDDFAIMLIFFSKAKLEYSSDIRLGYMKVVAGETVGFSIILCFSLIGMLIGMIVPEDYVDLIGFFPLVVGLYKTYEVMEEDGCLPCCSRTEKPASDQVDETTKGKYERVKTVEDEEAARVEGPLIEEPISSYNNPSEASATLEPEEEPESNVIADTFKSACRSFMDPLVLEVMTYALMVSVDNIAIYISLFASMKPWEVFLTVGLFYVLLFVNIIAAVLLMEVSIEQNLFIN
jgi:cadmium resistance protein CadD (predicted permease)